MKLDILVFAAHPDDAELGCGGTIAAHVAKGLKVGVVDLTKGEMGTRGTPELRMQEAAKSAEILGLAARENLGFNDYWFEQNPDTQKAIITAIRKYQPDVILANAITDRHPDHGKAAALLKQANFGSGLRRIETQLDGKAQEAWRAKVVYNYIQSRYIEPTFVVDVTEQWQTKINAVMAFSSQFHNPESNEPETFISSPRFMRFVEARARELGQRIGVEYAEGFTVERTPGVNNLMNLF